MTLHDEDFELLARFFISEYENDAIGVSEWLDNEGVFDTEEDRDTFIKYVRIVAGGGRK